MIRTVHIDNFKCFKNFDIDLGPFTVIIGPNDSGKTAFLQAILLMTSIEPGRLMTHYEFEQKTGVTLGKSAFWRENPEQAFVISTEFSSGVMPGTGGFSISMSMSISPFHILGILYF